MIKTLQKQTVSAAAVFALSISTATLTVIFAIAAGRETAALTEVTIRLIGADETVQPEDERAEHNKVQQGFLDPHRCRLE